VALCVDLSFSMVQEDRWGPMKQTALALAHLIGSRFREDALEIIGFDRVARRLSPLGLAGVGDMRDVLQRRAAGDVDATLAFDVYCHRVKSYVGAYLAVLGRADAVVFTGGVGENAAPVRAASLAGLEGLGIAVDPDRNTAPEEGVRSVSPDGAAVPVLVVPADEELEIARQAAAAVGQL